MMPLYRSAQKTRAKRRSGPRKTNLQHGGQIYHEAEPHLQVAGLVLGNPPSELQSTHKAELRPFKILV